MCISGNEKIGGQYYVATDAEKAMKINVNIFHYFFFVSSEI